MAWHHALFELTLFMNIFVTLVYWVFIHHELIVTKSDPIEIFITKSKHCLPLLGMILNFLVTDIVFARKHVKPLLQLSFVYQLVNMLATFSRGRPLYHFLQWTDLKSYFFCAIIYFTVWCVFIL